MLGSVSKLAVATRRVPIHWGPSPNSCTCPSETPSAFAPLPWLQGLNERYRGIADAHRWLQANRSRFRGPVYGPLAVEVRLCVCVLQLTVS